MGSEDQEIRESENLSASAKNANLLKKLMSGRLFASSAVDDDEEGSDADDEYRIDTSDMTADEKTRLGKAADNWRRISADLKQR